MVAIVVGTVVTVGGAFAVGYGTLAIAATGLAFGALCGPWLGLRTTAPWDAKSAGGALLYVSTVTVVVAVSAVAWPTPDGGHLAETLSELPYRFLNKPHATILMAVGSLLFLTTTSNALVRCLLASARGDLEVEEQRLRGGRIIGILERLLIFGFAMTGAITAAALVTSAKSLLRFPEISKAGPHQVDTVTEYFLVGSLCSWLIALLPIPFLAL